MTDLIRSRVNDFCYRSLTKCGLKSEEHTSLTEKVPCKSPIYLKYWWIYKTYVKPGDYIIVTLDNNEPLRLQREHLICFIYS